MKFEISNIKSLLLILLLCTSGLYNCTNPKVRHEQAQEWISEPGGLKLIADELISELAQMQTDTLDCTADTYWEIVGKGKSYIPKLIDGLLDTTPTNIYHGCKNANLNIGELCYFALQEIGDFPTYIVTQIQFDLSDLKNGQSCWNFYDYLFDDANKADYRLKVWAFYNKSEFKFERYPDSSITECMKRHSISGHYKWKESY